MVDDFGIDKVQLQDLFICDGERSLLLMTKITIIIIIIIITLDYICIIYVCSFFITYTVCDQLFVY